MCIDYFWMSPQIHLSSLGSEVSLDHVVHNLKSIDLSFGHLHFKQCLTNVCTVSLKSFQWYYIFSNTYNQVVPLWPGLLWHWYNTHFWTALSTINVLNSSPWSCTFLYSTLLGSSKLKSLLFHFLSSCFWPFETIEGLLVVACLSILDIVLKVHVVFYLSSFQSFSWMGGSAQMEGKP